MKVEWSAQAMRDLAQIFDFIADDDPTAALRWVQRLQARAGVAAVAPRAGRVVPEFGRDDVREVYLRRYRIVYRVTVAAIQVLTVFEGHRQLGGAADDEA